eukprot:gene3376-21118_t
MQRRDGLSPQQLHHTLYHTSIGHEQQFAEVAQSSPAAPRRVPNVSMLPDRRAAHPLSRPSLHRPLPLHHHAAKAEKPGTLRGYPPPRTRGRPREAVPSEAAKPSHLSANPSADAGLASAAPYQHPAAGASFS